MVNSLNGSIVANLDFYIYTTTNSGDSFYPTPVPIPSLTSIPAPNPTATVSFISHLPVPAPLPNARPYQLSPSLTTDYVSGISGDLISQIRITTSGSSTLSPEFTNARDKLESKIKRVGIRNGING